MTKTYLFVCVHNAGRSQMAGAFFNQLADPAKARALSAGTRPAERVHPEVVAAMAELGIDLSRATPKFLTRELVEAATVLVTMGCGEECPAVPGIRQLEWSVDDPRGKPPERVREIREEILGRVRLLLEAEGVARQASQISSETASR